jgi:hypothetical protein
MIARQKKANRSQLAVIELPVEIPVVAHEVRTAPVARVRLHDDAGLLPVSEGNPHGRTGLGKGEPLPVHRPVERQNDIGLHADPAERLRQGSGDVG